MFKSFRKNCKIDAANKLIYHILLYENKLDFEKKKYAFKYWKVINSHFKIKREKENYELINGHAISSSQQKKIHTKQFTFMNSEDFKGMSKHF